MKRKPSEGGTNSRKRGGSNAAISSLNQSNITLPNGLGGETEHRDLTLQEYYEAEEILKVSRR